MKMNEAIQSKMDEWIVKEDDVSMFKFASILFCGSANINFNKNNQDQSKPIEHCFDCDYAEGIATCMPEDENFYPNAQIT
jgi:hypothetical protein